MWKHNKFNSEEVKKLNNTYKNKQIDRKEFETEENGLTKQDVMSENINEVLDKWYDDGFQLVPKEDYLNLDPEEGWYIHYITNENKVRMGGKLSNVDKEKEFLYIRSFMNFMGFSVQIKNIQYLFKKKYNKVMRPEDDSEVIEILKKNWDSESSSIDKFWKKIKELDLPSMIKKKHVTYFMKNKLYTINK